MMNILNSEFYCHGSTDVKHFLQELRGSLQQRSEILPFVVLVIGAVGYSCVLTCSDLWLDEIYTLRWDSSFLPVLLVSSSTAYCEKPPMPRHAQSATRICAEIQYHIINTQCVRVWVTDRRCRRIKWIREVWNFFLSEMPRQVKDLSCCMHWLMMCPHIYYHK